MVEANEFDFGRLGQIYCGIMDTVAERLRSISEAIGEVSAKPDYPENWRKAEFAYLQIRKCVEYIALAVLAAHRVGEYECQKLENFYKADIIFRDLERLNQHGFPRGCQIKKGDHESDHHFAERVTLSKRRMKKIYDDCAVHLHAGTLAGILQQEVPPYDLPRVAAWQTELETLLSQHHVMLPHIGIVMIVWLREPETGKSRAVVGAAEGPLQIEGDPTIYNNGGVA